MAKVSSKRQVTLPIRHCNELGIKPGDEVEIFIAEGRLTIVKNEGGSAAGVLSHLKVDKRISDEESRDKQII